MKRRGSYLSAADEWQHLRTHEQSLCTLHKQKHPGVDFTLVDYDWLKWAVHVTIAAVFITVPVTVWEREQMWRS